ncbi:hypothetical protein KXV85_004779, partial [Aspergillus fumigatus]
MRGIKYGSFKEEDLNIDLARTAGGAIGIPGLAGGSYDIAFGNHAIPVNEPRLRSPFQAIRSIDYTVIFVRDMAAMRRFYEEVLCFPLTRELSAGWI